MRGGLAALACAATVAACDIDFVAAPTHPSATTISARSEHGDSLVATVAVVHENAGGGTVLVIVAGDTAQWEELEGRRILHRATTRPDSMDPRVGILVERPGSALALDLPILARRGPAAWNAEGMLVLPVHLPEPGVAWHARQWRISFRNAAGDALLSIQAAEALPDPLTVPPALVPESAVTIEVVTHLIALLEEPRAAVAIQGSALVPLAGGRPGPTEP